ncbi:MAG: DNA internalization-related competence protein ComEC/Rec2 [Thermoanaerobaculia bacterium]
MSRGRTPALQPALFALAGVHLAATGMPLGGEPAAVPLGLLLTALGWGLGRRVGRACFWLGIGLLAVWGRASAAEECFPRIDLARPVELAGVQREPWQRAAGGWVSSVEVKRVRQKGTVLGCCSSLRISYGGESPPVGSDAVRLKGFVRRAGAHRNATRRHPLPRSPAYWRMHLKSRRFWREDRFAETSLVGPAGRRLRAWLEPGLSESESRPGISVARALVLGDRRALSKETTRSLRRFGLSHLFAVSGLHVALVGLLVHTGLRPAPHGPRLAATGVAVVGYLLLVGVRSSIVRATAMVLLGSWAVLRERPPDGRQALCVAAAGLALLDPALIFELGYQLTVSASAGILWLRPMLEERWQTVPRVLRSGLAATVGAQLASLPWTVSAFSIVHPLAPLFNLVAIPWMAGFGFLAFVGTAAGRILPALREGVFDLLDVAVRPLGWLELLPASSLWTWPIALTFWEACAASAALVAVLLARRAFTRGASVVVAIVLLLGPAPRALPEVVFLDVGQGDAILLRDGGTAVLVDGGGWRRGDLAARVTIPALARLGVRRLDRAIVSHSDVDHCQGVADLARYLPVTAVWTGSGAAASPCVRELVSIPRVRWRTVWRGERLTVGPLELEILHPAPAGPAGGNDGSLVIRAHVGGGTILLTGDIEASGEARLLREVGSERLRSRILKVAHHGSRTSTTTRFLRAVGPSVAAISAGRRNRYGHPSSEVLDRLRRQRAHVVRTDRDGMIRLRFTDAITESPAVSDHDRLGDLD